ncbi:MAG: NAD(P)-binding protein [Saprospiraceae bacterium]|nr:NAD(P)-binding protein [Saprospiraceae bacterium]
MSDLTKTTNLQAPYDDAGGQRKMKPIYVDHLPPCNAACPAGENIQSWLGLVQNGAYEKAWRVLTKDNPMPAIHGRTCYHPCENSCNRTYIDETVSIHSVERFLGDLALKMGWTHTRPSNTSTKKILIVGAGPSGLSAAYHLCRLGHEVHIYEAGPVAGGMMHFGIPAYRLPRSVLEKEIELIKELGVHFYFNRKVVDVLKEKKDGSFDAVFIAIGAHISKKVDIPQREAGKILDAISFLKSLEDGEKPKLGRRVAIYGGGNTAMDTARSVRRLGYEPLIIYRRDKEHMPAYDFEADEAMAEGVKINWLRTIKSIEKSTYTVEVMEIDSEGKPQPTGKFETLEADSLILALGQNADSEFLRKIDGLQFKPDGTVVVDSTMMTGHDGIFAGGDMVPDQKSVTIAVGHGKRAAIYINAYLNQTKLGKSKKNPTAGYERLQVLAGTEGLSKKEKKLGIGYRIFNFSEIKEGLSESTAIYEASRCLSCGNCFECDICYEACPDNAITKLGPGKRYRVDYNLCSGCAVCFEQCPCHAIEMVHEPREQTLPSYEGTHKEKKVRVS